MKKNIKMSRRNVLQIREGNPVRSMRWKTVTWDKLNALEIEMDREVKVNRIAEVAVNWGLAFLNSLSPHLRKRIFGAKITYEEQKQLQAELTKRLGDSIGVFKLEEKLGFAISRPAKELIRSEAKNRSLSMSEFARRRIIRECPEA